MSEASQYPNGRNWCAYAGFIARAKREGRRYGFGRDQETGALGLFIEEPIYNVRAARWSKKRSPVLMRATGPMRAESTSIHWK